MAKKNMKKEKLDIPRPTPFDEMPQPEIPEAFRPLDPGPLRITEVSAGGKLELSVIYKRTYTFEHDKPPQLADEQSPLEEDCTFHGEFVNGRPASYKSLPEIIGYKTGTDLVVQANAKPIRPVTEMIVWVQVGSHRHTALVFGRRVCEYIKGKLVFSPPEPFEEIPLTYENAYGGVDENFRQELFQEVERLTSSEILRKAKPSMEELLAYNNPLFYPRNRFGKGYVLEDRKEFIEGRELPNMERIDDQLTPERLVVRHPFEWLNQPVPVGFDFLDPSSFPRSAMLGMPHYCFQSLEQAREVSLGLIPEDFARGNFFDTPPSKYEGLVHPAGSRCASLGLWLPFLRGNENIILSGMDPDYHEFVIKLPNERPVFLIDSPEFGSQEIGSEMNLITIRLEEKTMEIVWNGRTPLERPLFPGRHKELIELTKTTMVEV